MLLGTSDDSTLSIVDQHLHLFLRRLDRVRLVVDPLELLEGSTLRLDTGISTFQDRDTSLLTRRSTT